MLLRVRAYVSGIDGTTSDIVLGSCSLGLASVGLRRFSVGRSSVDVGSSSLIVGTWSFVGVQMSSVVGRRSVGRWSSVGHRQSLSVVGGWWSVVWHRSWVGHSYVSGRSLSVLCGLVVGGLLVVVGRRVVGRRSSIVVVGRGGRTVVHRS